MAGPCPRCVHAGTPAGLSVTGRPSTARAATRILKVSPRSLGRIVPQVRGNAAALGNMGEAVRRWNRRLSMEKTKSPAALSTRWRDRTPQSSSADSAPACAGGCRARISSSDELCNGRMVGSESDTEARRLRAVRPAQRAVALTRSARAALSRARQVVQSCRTSMARRGACAPPGASLLGHDHPEPGRRSTRSRSR
jgi:hypothetical protein